jgi:hypothetical protein
LPCAPWRSRWLAAGLGLAGFFLAAPAPAASWSTASFELPGGGDLAYVSGLPAEPARYRVYVVPGSGCRGMAPIAPAYFEGLRAAEVVVLHKPHVDPARWPGPPDCGDAFVRHDRLDTWAGEARSFLAWHVQAHPLAAQGGEGPAMPVVLVGISEGAELVPVLAPVLPASTRVVLVGSTGLDPLEALGLQAQRQAAPDFVFRLRAQVRDLAVPDHHRWAGRSLGYWRSLAAWPLAEPLLRMAGPPVWMGFGEADAQVPLAGLARFVERARARGRSLCVAVFAGADHGLQAPGHDALQTLWGWVEGAVLAPAGGEAGPCGPLRPNDLEARP